MTLVKYPYHVRHDGRDYAPGEPIAVDDASDHLKRGAVIIEADENPKTAPKKRRAQKTEA